MKCQWKQVKGLWAVHLCCRNSGHCSTRNSFRYLDDSKGKKIMTTRKNVRKTKKITNTPTCNGKASPAVFEKGQLIYFRKKWWYWKKSLQDQRTTCCFGDVRKPNARASQHRQTSASWELLVWLVKIYHVIYFDRLKKKPANVSKYANTLRNIYDLGKLLEKIDRPRKVRIIRIF